MTRFFLTAPFIAFAMRIDAITLTGFRNYEEQSISFVPGVNLIVGDNAQGKTNLLEAVTYLSVGRSFRTRREAELIRFGAEFADLQADIFSHEREMQLRAILFSGRRPRQLFIGGVKQKTAEALSGLLTTVLFCPDDLSLLLSGAANRRRLLDAALCQLRPRYAAALSEYTRLYEQKSRILKDRFENPSLLQVLPEYNTRMAQVGALLISGRAKYLRELSKYAELYHEEFSSKKERLELHYKTVSTITDPFVPPRLLYEKLLEHQKSHHTAELESMQCLSGPHKDDFEATVNGLSIKSFGSQGQVRTAAISIKLAERRIFKDDTGEEPILLLDDVLSELDPGRQDFVLNQIKTGQVLITCCEKDKLTNLGKVIFVENGRVQEGRT